MRVRNGVRFALCAVTAATIAGCAAGISGGRETVGISFMLTEPPRERVEVVSTTPGPEYVWIKGYWVRSGNEYTWREGRWERPSAGFRTWVPGRWERERRGWYWVEGHWS